MTLGGVFGKMPKPLKTPRRTVQKLDALLDTVIAENTKLRRQNAALHQLLTTAACSCDSGFVDVVSETGEVTRQVCSICAR
jgi:hypothetical protein